MELDLILQALNGLNSNRVFIGVTMMIMNIGSRYVIADLTEVHQKIMSSPLFKQIILFCMFFVATRDIMTSLILTFAFVVIMHGLLNEKRKFNLLPNKYKKQQQHVQETQTPRRVVEQASQIPKNERDDVHRLMFQSMLNTFEPLKNKFF
jgi:hypothetical protein